MSTCNFSQPTLSKIYSIGARYEEFDYDEVIADIQFTLSHIPGYTEDNSEPGHICHRDTSVLGYFSWEVKIDEDWEVYKLYITCEGGYFCGIKIDIEHDEYLQLEYLTKTAMNRILAKIRRIESVLAKITTPIRRIAVFSNGEAIYQLA